jgi:hypothetical protein
LTIRATPIKVDGADRPDDMPEAGQSRRKPPIAALAKRGSRNKAVEKRHRASQETGGRSSEPLSLHPLSVEDALRGAMGTGKPPEPENKHAKRSATKRRLKGEAKSNREIAMSIWELAPIHLNDENWQRGPWKGLVIIRAATENRARDIACCVFDTATERTTGQSSLHCPWRDDNLARCRRIEGYSYPADGPEAILEPAAYDDEWKRVTRQ